VSKKRRKNGIPQHGFPPEAASLPNFVQTFTQAERPFPESTPVPLFCFHAGLPTSQPTPWTFQALNQYHAVPAYLTRPVPSATQMSPFSAPLMSIPYSNWRPTPLPNQQTYPSHRHVPAMNEWVQYGYDPQVQVPISQDSVQEVDQVRLLSVDSASPWLNVSMVLEGFFHHTASFSCVRSTEHS
jgi:hypothetical protein